MKWGKGRACGQKNDWELTASGCKVVTVDVCSVKVVQWQCKGIASEQSFCKNLEVYISITTWPIQLKFLWRVHLNTRILPCKDEASQKNLIFCAAWGAKIQVSPIRFKLGTLEAGAPLTEALKYQMTKHQWPATDTVHWQYLGSKCTSYCQWTKFP